jgi:hypothetical protein
VSKRGNALSEDAVMRQTTCLARAKSLYGVLALVVLALAVVPANGVAAKSVVATCGTTGGAEPRLGGQLNNPDGVAVNNSNGNFYVVDGENHRIQQFDSSCNFIRAWGFDTIQAGKPGDLGSTAFETCSVAADCKKGINTVSPAPGGELSIGAAAGGGVAVNQATGNVYVLNKEFLRVDEFAAGGAFIRAFGQDVVQSGKPGNANEIQAITVRATAGQLRLTFGAGGPGVSETGDLPFNATAAEVQTALNALTNISAGLGSVAVSGGPGDEQGTNRYVVTFSGGALAETNVAQMGAVNGTTPLSGGSPTSTAFVLTTNQGQTGFEVCTAAADCKTGTAGSLAGAFSNLGANYLGIAPVGTGNEGNVFVADRGNRRVSEFTAAGVFVRAFGADMISGGASGTGTLNSSTSVTSVTTTSKAFEKGQQIEAPGIPSGTTITAVGSGTITLSQAATASGAVTITAPTGSANVGQNEQQLITVKGTGGTFVLTFTTPNPSPTTATTPALSFSASAAEVQSALEGLSNIGAGNVSVSSEPGLEAPYSRFLVEFKGVRFADTDVAQLTASFSAGIGTQLRCLSTTTATNTSFQWLSNGASATGPGATTSTYTTVAADAGKPVQCQILKTNSNAGSTQVSTPATIVAPTPATAPPTPPASFNVSGTVAAGNTLTCPTSGWGGSPSFAFQWYRNGTPIAAATASTYVVQAADVATPAVFQCEVTGTNAGGSVAKVSQNKATSPAPNPAAPPSNTTSPNVTVPAVGTLSTRQNGSTAFEMCRAGIDACKEGALGSAPTGSGIGQFGNNSPTSVVEAPSGVIYTGEKSPPDFRVQKFTPSGQTFVPSLFTVNNEVQKITVNATAGQFLLSFGAGTGSTTADINYNASAAEVQAALNELNTIQTVNETPGGSVSVSGPAGGPYLVEFNGGPFKSADVAQMTSTNGTTPLSGGSEPGANKAIVTTTAQGAPGGGELNTPTNIALDASGNLLLHKGYLSGSTPSCLNTNAASVEEEKRLLEISPGGSLLGTQLGCGGITRARGIAVDPSSGAIYWSTDSPSSAVYVVNSVISPTATIAPVTEVDAFSATFRGEVNPNGAPTAECRFDFIPKAAYEANLNSGEPGKPGFFGATKLPCEQNPVGTGTGPLAVSATTTAVVSNTAYKVRLVATKAPFGDVAVESGTVEFSTSPEPPPTVITGAAAPRTTTSARLSGLVNPNNSATEVHFEYGTQGDCASNPCTSTSIQSVGSEYVEPGKPYKAVVAELEGLQPDTTYHYRLVGTNAKGTTAGADLTFTTRPLPPSTCANDNVRAAQQSDGYLGNCRAIELVNNPDKGNQNAFASGPEVGTSPLGKDGEEALWTVNGGAPGSPTGTAGTFLARRSASGWASQSLIPPAAEQVGGGSDAYRLETAAPDFSNFVFGAGRVTTGGLKLGFTGAGTIVRLDRDQDQSALASYEELGSFSGAGMGIEQTDDGSHVFLVDPKTRQLVDIGSGTEETVSLLPPPDSPVGVPQPGGTPSGCKLSVEGESFIGIGGGGGAAAAIHWRQDYRRIATTDGSRVYFQAPPNGECAKPFDLYVRNIESETTTLIGDGAGSPELIRATPDGRHAYFTTRSKLDPADKNTDIDIYRWDEEAGESACLTCVVPDARIATAAAKTVPVMVSDDFSHVYFDSTRQLVLGHGKEGDVNRYALSGEEIRFVADTKETEFASMLRKDSLLSSDGNVLLFTARPSASLTSDAVAAECPDPHEPGEINPCRQLYRYDDRDGSLECVSCNRRGTTTQTIGTTSLQAAPDFKLSGDGSTVAFASQEALLPTDVNEGTDVYEWRNGAVNLITDGTTSFQTGFSAPAVRAVDGDGSDILFTVDDPGLTGFEQDGLLNVYDARIGGGFIPAPPPTHCSEEECQGPVQAAPGEEPSASSTYSGRGNVEEPPVKPRRPCAKGKVRRHGRCVTRHRHHRKRASNTKQGRTK